MIVPTKFTPLDESVLGKVPVILQGLDKCDSVHELYKLLESRFEDVGQFLFALDVLFVLSAVELDPTTETLRRC